jgi:endonuclease/exonuclease/phosphatase family metal-dependent hydrolase
MPLTIRTWNLFHGNTDPPGRRAYLRQMIELVTRDRPDVVCLQEVPVWSLARLSAWSGMHAVGAVARRPRLRRGSKVLTSV